MESGLRPIFQRNALSTIAAALPVVTLLVLIASNKVKAHIAAVIALIVANLVAIYIFTMPAGMSLRATVLGAVDRLLPDRLDRAQRHLPLPADGGERRVRDLADHDRRRHDGSPPAASADRVLLRRLLRGRVRLRHAGRRHRRDPDRARLLAARRLRPLADRQHGAGRLRRARHADRGPRQRHRHRSVSPRRDGRTAIAVLLADRAVLADLGLRRLEGHEGRSGPPSS